VAGGKVKMTTDESQPSVTGEQPASEPATVIEPVDTGSGNSANERIQELVNQRRGVQEELAAERAARSEDARRYDDLRNLIDSRIPDPRAAAPEEEEWVDPGEKALRRIEAMEMSQREREDRQAVFMAIQREVGKRDFADPQDVMNELARDYYADSHLGRRFDPAAAASEKFKKESDRAQAWAKTKVEQADATASVVTEASPASTTNDLGAAPPWGTREREEWDKKLENSIFAQFRAGTL